MLQANVRRAIESHLMDSSPAVRDAAVELIGKYLVLSPELVDDYYPQFANRIAVCPDVFQAYVVPILFFSGHWTSCTKACYQAPQEFVQPDGQSHSSSGHLHQACAQVAG